MMLKNKSTKKTVLPIDFPTFVNDAKIFFNSLNEVYSILDGIEKSKHKFSTSFVKNILKSDVRNAESVRNVCLYLIHILKSHDVNLSVMSNDLITIGCNKIIVRKFFERIEKMNKEVLEACKDLYEVDTYGTSISKLINTGTEINHTFLESDLKKMTARITLKLVTKGIDEERGIEIDMGANEFESFILRLMESKELLLNESKKLKELIGDKYIMPIGDV